MNKVIHGECLEELKKLPENSVDSIVTDPPYGLSFMGKKWDYDVPSTEIWSECLRVLKPGGYLLAFAGTRTQHRMAVRIEDAGFEIRDMIAWIYGSGFPKSLNIGKAVDKLQGNEREELGVVKGAGAGMSEWEGWGTALKPALEPITVARKPLSEKTVAENCLKWGTGGINIDGSRVEYTSKQDKKEGQSARPSKTSNANEYALNHGGLEGMDRSDRSDISGRFPANLIHDGSEEVTDCFPNDSQRFFYQAKASKSERNKGCEDMEDKERIDYGGFHSEKGLIENNRNPENRLPNKNNHPTVKPIALMEYLVKLVTKQGGTVLDPFAGSGSTLIAAKKNNYNYIGIEMEADYIDIINARLAVEN